MKAWRCLTWTFNLYSRSTTKNNGHKRDWVSVDEVLISTQHLHDIKYCMRGGSQDYVHRDDIAKVRNVWFYVTEIGWLILNYHIAFVYAPINRRPTEETQRGTQNHLFMKTIASSKLVKRKRNFSGLELCLTLKISFVSFHPLWLKGPCRLLLRYKSVSERV